MSETTTGRELSAAKRALLEARLRGEKPRTAGTAAESASAPIPRRAPGQDIPLSFAQERFWFLDRLQPGLSSYNIPAGLRLTGALDAGAVERALGTLVRRHELLRTTFHEVDGVPLQVVAPAGALALPVEDLSGLDADPRAAAVQRLVAEEAVRPFDLATGPLFRPRLLRLAQDEHVLLMCMHHVVSDGWSGNVILREIAALYEAYREGREPALPELPVQYGDYALWQRHHLRGAALERQVAYWRQMLAGAPELLELPADHPRPPVPSSRGATVPVIVRPEVLERLRVIGRAEGATLYMVVLATFQALLGRYAGVDDVVVGAPVSGRTRSEVEGLVGPFVNTLVLRTDLSGDPPFRELVRRVRETVLGGLGHQDVPFERLVAELQPERSLSHSPLFQVVFMIDDLDDPAAGAAESAVLESTRDGLRVQAVVPEATSSRFDLTLALKAHVRGITGTLQYSTDLFGAATAARMAEHVVRLLTRIGEDGGARLSALDLLSDGERRQVLAEWGGADASPAAASCIHPLVAAQAARTPDAVALVSGGEALTYGELDRAANRLAHHLAARGAGPESVVAIVAERTPRTAVAMLAVLKAGAAYLPLDPAYPAERLRFMRADAAARLVVADGPLPEGLRDDAVGVVDLRAEADAVATRPDHAPDAAVHPDNLAYVIYTSGSTGRPKGVAVAHRGVPHLAAWKRSRLGQGPGDRALQFASFSFDAAVEELFGCLLAGGTLVMAPREALMPGEPLRRTLVDGRVAFATLPPAVLAVMDPAELPDLRVVVSAGEALPATLAERWAGAVQLHDAYGPTEATVAATSRRVPAEGGAASIGRPLEHVRVRVLDGRMGLVPAGIPGELYVGGAGLARGYLGRPALTAERFVPDPFSAVPGARLYRTGDRAYWRPDGTLAYGGRLDAQVKVRGFRIEPGEIEAALLRQADVSAAAVAVREDAPGDRRLVAYVVGGAQADALRAGLRQALPEHMVPAAFVALTELPRTPSGKLDRRAFPAPDYASAPERYVAPRTQTEALLARIWADVLRVERVGAADSFFGLGGHSLLAIRMASRVRDAFAVELPLRVVFERPVMGELAERIDALRSADGPVLPPVVPVDRQRRLPLSFAQERLWFLDRLQPDSPVYNIALALRLTGALDVAALERALGEIVRRHETLRTVFREADGAPVQVIAPFTGFALPLEDLSTLEDGDREAELRRRATAEAARPFDLAAGPLLRATLLRLGDDRHALLVTLHHVVSDAWSAGILFREMVALYAAFRDGFASPLPELPVQYADFAVWQREQLQGAALERQLAWWTERLSDAPALLELPTDRPRPAVQAFRGAKEAVDLSPALLQRLQALGRTDGATLFMVLLGAFQVLLGKYAGTRDVVVGTPIAGRARGEVEGLIGFFVNTLVLRTDLGGDPSFRGLLRRVRETTLGAYQHQDVPFEKLVAELQPERSMSHAPLFQVMFSMQNAEAPVEAVAGLEIGGVAMDAETSKFDLTLSLAESAAGLRGSLAYATDLWEPATIRRMARHLERVLEQVAADPDLRLSSLELAGPDERRQVVDEWNRTERPYPREACIHTLFHAQVCRTPDAPALEWDGVVLTYAELDARANRLAHHLAGLGVAPEQRVGVLLDRGAELVVSILAILKAGGAYVPLDPAYPPDRLRRMVAGADARVVVSRAELRGALGESDARFVCLREAADAVAAAPADAPASGATALNLAYVFYTSGSTGRPKGVMVSHREVVQLACGIDYLRMGPGERVAQASSTSFDAAVFEIWGALLNGATLVGVGREALLSAPALAAVLRERRVTLLYQPAALFAQHVREQVDVYAGLRQLVFGGEAAPMDGVRRMLREGRPERVLHVYGPTETTVWCTTDPVDAVADDAPTVPIGRPTANARTYVLGPALEPLPAGVAGELCVGGEGVARGYVGRPALTAERFVPDPYAARPGARMYRTGDRIRWGADGRLEFLGRLDEQVKIRGFRVEPGEVESALFTHPAVREARVLVREDHPGERRLVAYVVGGVEPDALRAHLRESLPEYMVPGAFVVLDRLPLTAVGKLDRRALPAPDLAPAKERYVAPATATEEVLAGIWAEVLHLERVGRHDGFFELGGHSLLIVRLQSRLRERLGRDVPVVDLFRFPTVAALAEHLGGAPETAEPAPAPGGDRAALRRRMAARRGGGAGA